MNYYERHLGDYARDAAHLSMLEHGAYVLLMDRYYVTEQGIPADQAHRVARARSADEQAAVDAVLGEFFTLAAGVWTKNRIEEEIAKAHVRITAAVENGKKGGRPKNPKVVDPQTQEEPAGFSLGLLNETGLKAHQAPDTTYQAPDTKHQAPDTTEGQKKTPRKRGASSATTVGAEAMALEGVDAQHAADWLLVRKEKKLPLTGTAWTDTKDEAAKAKITIGTAVHTAVKQGWGGFKASWYFNLQGKGSTSEASPDAEANRRAASNAEAKRLLGFTTGETIDA
jgi:uncharacterized protein YdaU (DUF1376 family)